MKKPEEVQGLVGPLDVSCEEWREYRFESEFGDDVTVFVDRPKWLYIKPNETGSTESHRVICEDGVVHYIPLGWKSITWVADPPVAF